MYSPSTSDQGEAYLKLIPQIGDTRSRGVQSPMCAARIDIRFPKFLFFPLTKFTSQNININQEPRF